MNSSSDLFELAYASYIALNKSVAECRQLHIDAGLPVPPKVAAFLGESIRYTANERANLSNLTPTKTVEKPKRRYQMRVASIDLKLPPKPDYGPPPVEANGDWVSMKAIGASPHALAIAVLKARGPIERAELSRVVSGLRGLKGSNAGYNALDRLVRDRQARETHGGYVLIDQAIGGILVGDILWSPEDQLTDADRAAHRREGILLLLKLNTALLSAEISRGLDECGWIRAGKNRNFVKADMAQLERENRVTRREDKKWLLA